VTRRKPKVQARSARRTAPDPRQPDSNEQSGSTGRNTDADKIAPDKDTGQDQYGQTGFGGVSGHETIGQANYRKSGSAAVEGRKSASNEGSGRADREANEYQGARGKGGRPRKAR
jgi:hypothetical protein